MDNEITNEMQSLLDRVEIERQHRRMPIYRMSEDANVCCKLWHKWRDGRHMPSLYAFMSVCRAVGLRLTLEVRK